MKTITKEHYDSITYEDVKDFSVDEELLASLIFKFNDFGLSEEQIGRLVASYVKVIMVSFKMGLECGQPVN